MNAVVAALNNHSRYIADLNHRLLSRGGGNGVIEVSCKNLS